MKTLLFALALFLIGCGQANPEWVQYVQEHNTPAGKVWTLSDGTQGTKRILLIHGLTKDHTFWYNNEVSFLVWKLWKSGYQIMFIDLPYTTDPEPFTRLKAVLTPTYAGDFQNRITKVLDFGDSIWGQQDTEIGGASWGGLHTMMACAREPRCTHFFALIPVPDISALRGFENYSLSNFSPLNEIAPLGTKKGYVAYGGADALVSPTITKQLTDQLAPLGTIIASYPQYHHEEPYPMINALLEWELKHEF